MWRRSHPRRIAEVSLVMGEQFGVKPPAWFLDWPPGQEGGKIEIPAKRADSTKILKDVGRALLIVFK